MSKTFVYTLLVIGVYVLIIYPKGSTSTSSATKNDTEEAGEVYEADTKNGTGLNENADENGISQGAAGRMKYQYGYVK